MRRTLITISTFFAALLDTSTTLQWFIIILSRKLHRRFDSCMNPENNSKSSVYPSHVIDVSDQFPASRDHKLSSSHATHAMADTADTGDLETLPPELRKEIYAHLLVETKKISIKRLRKEGKAVRMDNHRHKDHPGKFYDRSQQDWVDAPPCTTSLLLVNSAVSVEATQVLYGFNKFDFEHTCALWTFLESIGKSKQYLRHIAIVGYGVLYFGSLVAMKRSVKLLQHSPSLRSLEISHFALCDQQNNLKFNIQTLVAACAPLLKTLKITFEKEGVNVNVLDVIKIELPLCSYSHGSAEDHEAGHAKWSDGLSGLSQQRSSDGLRRLYQRPGTIDMYERTCFCAAAEDKNKKLTEELKREIGKQLGAMN
jgi:hypothetical protein